MSKLPLKLKLGLRDSWDAPDTELRRALTGLQAELGVAPRIDPDWGLLWAALEDAYRKDAQTFVSVAAGLVEAWATAFTQLLQSDEPWSDRMAEAIGGRLQVFVEVSQTDKASTSWSKQREGFVLCLPRTAVLSPLQLVPDYKVGLVAAFAEEQPAAAAPHEDEYITVDTPPAAAAAAAGAPTAAFAGLRVAAARDVPAVLPSLKTLPSPDQLLLRPPYHLIVMYGNGLEVQCSHSPTLELLSEYLHKWCKVNHRRVDQPPVMDIVLHPSPFGLGQLYDRLTIRPSAPHGLHEATAPAVLHLVETLGFVGTYTDGARWVFRRDQEWL